jgi:GxxExxY protein
MSEDRAGGYGYCESEITAKKDGEITEQIIGAAFEVHSVLGYGFLERVYQRAMQVELTARGLEAETESKIKVMYKGVVVGEYQADLLVADQVIVELKVAKEYRTADEAQLLNELKATGIKVGLLINFGRTKVEFRRLVF